MLELCSVMGLGVGFGSQVWVESVGGHLFIFHTNQEISSNFSSVSLMFKISGSKRLPMNIFIPLVWR